MSFCRARDFSRFKNSKPMQFYYRLYSELFEPFSNSSAAYYTPSMKKALYLLLCINSNNDKISISSGNSQVGSASNLQSRRNSLVAPPSVDGLAKASSSDLNLAANRESPRTSQRRGSLTGRVSHSLYKLVGSFRVNPLVLNRVNPLVLNSMKAYDIKSNPKKILTSKFRLCLL